MLKLMMSSLFLIVISVSCSKNDDNSNSACPLSAANIAGSYKITAIKYKASATTPEIDAYATFLDDCQKDDIYVFNTNGVVNYNDAGVACSPSGTTTGTWSLSGNNLVIDGDAYAITSFNCTTAVGTISNVATTGDVATFTFTKQ